MQERRGHLCSTTESCLSLAETSVRLCPGRAPRVTEATSAPSPTVSPPIHDSCGTAYFRHWMPPSGSGASSSSEALGAFRCRRIFLQPRPPAASTILSVRGARPDTSRGPSWPWPGPWSTTIRRRPYGDLSSAHSSLRRERPFALSLPAARTCGRLTRTGSCGPLCSASPSSARIASPLGRSAEPLSPTRPLTRGTDASAVTRSVATDRRTLGPFDCCDRALRPPLGAMPAATPSPPPGRPRALEELCQAHEH